MQRRALPRPYPKITVDQSVLRLALADLMGDRVRDAASDGANDDVALDLMVDGEPRTASQLEWVTNNNVLAHLWANKGPEVWYILRFIKSSDGWALFPVILEETVEQPGEDLHTLSNLAARLNFFVEHEARTAEH